MSSHDKPDSASLLKSDAEQANPVWAGKTDISRTSDGDEVYTYYAPEASESGEPSQAFVSVVFPKQSKCIGGGPTTRGLSPDLQPKAAYEEIRDVDTYASNVSIPKPDMKAEPSVSKTPTTISDAYYEMIDPMKPGFTIKPYYSVVDDDGATSVGCSVLFVNRTYGPTGFDPAEFAQAVNQGDRLASTIKATSQEKSGSPTSASASA